MWSFKRRIAAGDIEAGLALLGPKAALWACVVGEVVGPESFSRTWRLNFDSWLVSSFLGMVARL